ncbi:MAG: ArsR/SmtB family transcription factor [Thermoplasmata archaeon]
MSRIRTQRWYPSVSSTAESIAGLARLVADPRRVAILEMLRAGPATVTEISLSLGLRASATSIQLHRLRAARRVRVVPCGRHRIYSVDLNSVAHLLDRLGEAAGGADPR